MKTKAKSEPHAKLLAEAAVIIGCGDEGWWSAWADRYEGRAVFESRCLDWLDEKVNYSVTRYGAREPVKVTTYSIIYGVPSAVIATHKLRHVALAKAVVAVNRQKGA